MDTKKLEEFTQKVKAGDITDFEPWFEEQDLETLQALKQICIRHGVHQEAYTDWALDGRDPWIQQMLASNGYCLDILIYAEDAYVREVVLKKELRRALEPNVMEANLGLVRTLLMSAPDPDKEVLDAFVQTANEFKGVYDYEALYQKHAAHKNIPTTIEKTMTPLQLFKADNLLWTLPYSGDQVALVNNALRDPLNELTAEFIFSALDYGVRTSSELMSYILYHQTA